MQMARLSQIDHVVEVVAQPAVGGAGACLLQRFEVGAAGGETGEDHLQHPWRLGLGAPPLRAHQGVEVEPGHGESGRAADHRHHRRAERHAGEHQQRGSRQAEQGETPRVDVEPCGAQSHALSLHRAVEQ